MIHDEKGAVAPRYIPAYMGFPKRRPRQIKGGRSGSRPRYSLRTRSASRRITRHQRLQPEELFPHHLRGRLLQGSWLPREIQPKDRQVPPLTQCPPTILGTHRVCMHPHRSRRHYPHRHRERLRVRPRQGPPFHYRPTQA
jgi:hypothetical protein